MKPRVLIVGTGAGGSVIAKKMADAFAVTVMEEGDYQAKFADLKSITSSFINLYRYGGVLPIFSSPMIGFAEGRVVGGSTVVNGGLLWRTPLKILDGWLSKKQISREIYDKYDVVFKAIEERLSVNSRTLENSNKDSLLLSRGSEKLGWKVVDVPRAVVGCVNQNRCPSSCTSGAKQSMDKTYLADALDSGIKLVPGAKVERLIVNGGRIEGVRFVSKGTSYLEKFDFVFICAGAIQTPALLRRSGIKTGIGDTLALHVNMKFVAFYDEFVNADEATIFSKQVQEFEDEGTLIMATNFNESWATSALESKGIDAINMLRKNIKKAALYTTQIKPKGVGRVRNFLGLGTFCTFKFCKDDADLMRRAIIATVKVLIASGATSIYLPISNSRPIHSLREAINVVDSLTIKSLELVSVHAMSTVPMGKDGPVNYDGSLRGFDNLYIADASILPSNIGESPQGTIMYFAHCIADAFFERMKFNKLTRT